MPGLAPPVGVGWTIRRLDGRTAAEQMAIDERLAAAAQPTFRLFRWSRPAVSLGLKQAPPSWICASQLSAHGIDVVRRPTGGGAALHGSDLSFSVVEPLSAGWRIGGLVETVAHRVSCGLRTLGMWVEWQREDESAGRIIYCLTEPSPYALMVGERKLGGMAIRRTRASWLIQGSILMRPLPDVFRAVMPEAVRAAFETHAISVEDARGARVSDEDVMAACADAV